MASLPQGLSPNHKWWATFRIPNYTYNNVHSITRLSDGGLAITGMTKSFGDSYGDAYVMKLSSSGDLQWAKIFSISRKA